MSRAEASPGIFLSGVEPNVFHTNRTRVWDFAPTRSGEELVVYASGLGPVDQQVSVGSPAPASPVVKAVNVPAVRVGGQLAEVRSATLTPGAVGIYQVSFVVPNGLSGRVPLVLESGAVTSNSITIPVQP